MWIKMNYLKNITLPILLIFLFAACQPESEPSGDEAVAADSITENAIILSDRQMKTINLKTGKINKRNIKNEIKATGYIHIPPHYTAAISTYVDGYVKSSRFLVGDYVKRGQTLAVLENPDYIDIQKTYMEAQSQINYLQNEYERQEALSRENINAKKDLIKAEAEYKKALALYNSTREKLKLLKINLNDVEKGNFTSLIHLTSPISGYISAVNCMIGKYVSPSHQLFEVINKEHLHLELKVYEKDALKIKKGQKVKFSVPSINSETFPAEVYLVGQSLEGSERVITVHAHIDDQFEDQFISNMYVNASIVIDDDYQNSLPEQAIVRDGQNSYVFIKDEENNGKTRFNRIQVNTGSSKDGYIAVSSLDEMKDNVEVVTEGAFYLLTALQNGME